MSLVKTEEEIEQFQARLSSPHFFDSEVLTVLFESDPTRLSALLPPDLEPAEGGRAVAMVGSWRSNCAGDFKGGAVYVKSRYQGQEGDYVLAMYMDRDSPAIYGRDLLGEPKKLAEVEIEYRGDRHSGRLVRKGTELIAVELERGEALGPSSETARRFNIKARPSADGIGLEEDAIVTSTRFEVEVSERFDCRAELRIAGSPHDPLHELPVGDLVAAQLTYGASRGRSSKVGTIAAADYLPYFYARHGDDWAALDSTVMRKES